MPYERKYSITLRCMAHVCDDIPYSFPRAPPPISGEYPVPGRGSVRRAPGARGARRPGGAGGAGGVGGVAVLVGVAIALVIQL